MKRPNYQEESKSNLSAEPNRNVQVPNERAKTKLKLKRPNYQEESKSNLSAELKQEVQAPNESVKESTSNKGINSSEKKQEFNTRANVNKELKENKKYFLSKRMLKSAEYVFDNVINQDDDNLGIETILKTKKALKKTGKIINKNYKIGKPIANKIKFITGEKAKKIYADTINSTQKIYKNINELSQRKNVKNKHVIKNTLKGRQKKEIWKQARNKAKEQVVNTSALVLNKIKNLVVNIIFSKGLLIGLILTFVLLIIFSPIIGIASIFAFSVNLTVDENITMISEYLSELDYDINSKIDNVEETYSYGDRFVYNVPKRANTDYEPIYVYLKAKYSNEKLSQTKIKAEIKEIHDNLYDLTINVTSKKITKTREDGTKYSYRRYTVTTTLKTQEFSDYYIENKDYLLEDNQQEDYINIQKMIDENVGKTLNNPFKNVDWRNHVSSEYGYRNNPITDDEELHLGIDIKMSKGTKIYASMGGKVNIFTDDELGKCITITKGKEEILYAHCNKILVSDGDKVNVGELIAEVGSTGNTLDNHLHFEYIVKGENKNPRAYLKN